MNSLIATILGAGLALGQTLPPSPEAVMALPDELAALAEQAAVVKASNERERLDYLADLFRGRGELDFQYSPRPTRTVAATFAAGEGNCLAFTLAFIAVARRAGLDAYPREVRVPDQWRRMGTAVFSVGHVNVGVDTPQRDAIVDLDPDLMRAQRLAQPFRGRRISDERALAHFYNNRAVELMVEGQLPEAGQWLDQALDLDESFAPAWITRGILARKTGRLDAAEDAFLAALQRDERSANALFNLIGLQRQQGDRAGMIHYGRRLEALDPDDPYLLWELGRLQRDLAEPELARDSFERAVRLTGGGDPMLVTGLVEVLFELGAYEEARRYLERSMPVLAAAAEPGDKLARLLEFKKGL